MVPAIHAPVPRSMGSVGFFIFAVLLLVAGCTTRPATPPARSVGPIVLTDDAGVSAQLAHPAQRIISLIPSVTDGILALDAGSRLVGRSTTDRVPPGLDSLPIVGDGLTPSAEQVVAQRPELVILWAGDKRNDLRRQLEAAGIATLGLAVEDTADAIRSLTLLGRALGLEARADSVILAVRSTMDSVARATANAPRPRVFYVVGAEPPLTVGPGTFIDQLLSMAGASNIFRDASTRWPSVSMEQVLARDPDVIILPSDAAPGVADRLRALPGWRDLRALTTGCVLLVNADLANRPGPRMGEAAAAFARGLDSLRTRCSREQ